MKHGYVLIGLQDNFGTTLLNIKPGTDTITNICENSCGVDTYSVSVTVFGQPNPPIVAQSSLELCVGDSAIIFNYDTASTGVDGYFPQFNGLYDTVKIKKNQMVLIARSPGFDTIAIVAHGICGYSQTDIPIKINNVPPITSPDSVCTNYSINLSDSIAGGLWSTADNNIAVVDAKSGIVSGRGEGVGTITYTLPSGCKTETNVQVKNCTTEAAVYPNPAFDELTIHLYVDNYKSYSLINTLGQIIVSHTLNGIFTTIDLSRLEKGIYFLRLSGEGKNFVHKVVKY